MGDWACGIQGRSAQYRDVKEPLGHQMTGHDRCTCAICGEMYPDGFFAIRHAFSEHTRVEYVRAYNANLDDARQRERIIELVEAQVDVPSTFSRLDVDAEDQTVSTRE